VSRKPVRNIANTKTYGYFEVQRHTTEAGFFIVHLKNQATNVSNVVRQTIAKHVLRINYYYTNLIYSPITGRHVLCNINKFRQIQYLHNLNTK